MIKLTDNYVAIDFSIRTKECNQNGHKWQLSGFYKHNPHLWCSHCGWYLDQNEIKSKGYTEVFQNLLKNDNPEGYYL